jgi:hypothetical protein
VVLLLFIVSTNSKYLSPARRHYRRMLRASGISGDCCLARMRGAFCSKADNVSRLSNCEILHAIFGKYNLISVYFEAGQCVIITPLPALFLSCIFSGSFRKGSGKNSRNYPGFPGYLGNMWRKDKLFHLDPKYI